MLTVPLVVEPSYISVNAQAETQRLTKLMPQVRDYRYPGECIHTIARDHPMASGPDVRPAFVRSSSPSRSEAGRDELTDIFARAPCDLSRCDANAELSLSSEKPDSAKDRSGEANRGVVNDS